MTNDVCETCGGEGMRTIGNDGDPITIECRTCKGTGRKPVKDAAERMSDTEFDGRFVSTTNNPDYDSPRFADCWTALVREAERARAAESAAAERIAALEAELADKKHDYAEGWNEGHDEAFKVTEEMRDAAECWRLWKAIIAIDSNVSNEISACRRGSEYHITIKNRTYICDTYEEAVRVAAKALGIEA